MNFGEYVKTLRNNCQLTQAQLAKRLDVSMSYISKVERGRLHFGDYPSEKFIHKLAEELDADEDELLMLADKVPLSIRRRIRERPEVFQVIAKMNDKQIDKLMGDLPKPSSKF